LKGLKSLKGLKGLKSFLKNPKPKIQIPKPFLLFKLFKPETLQTHKSPTPTTQTLNPFLQMTETRILGLLITDRIKEAGRTQMLLSKYSRLIRSRLGFHELNDNVCSRSGIIVLHLTGLPAEWKEFEDELSQIGGLEVQNMSFTY
jgi:hypothetical protein